VEESSLHDSEAGLTFASGGPNEARGNEITANTAVGLSLFSEDQTVIDGNHIYQNDGAQVQVWDQIGMDPSVPTHVRFARNDIGPRRRGRLSSPRSKPTASSDRRRC
jgi:hypothetical protein